MNRSDFRAPTPDPSQRFVSHTESVRVPFPPDPVLDWVVGVPLERVLDTAGGVPGVDRTEPLSGQWGAPGSCRRVVLSDGNTALEALHAYEPGSRFSYVVWDFTSMAGRLVNYAWGEFRARPEKGGTAITWTYRFQRKNPLTGLLLSLFVRFQFRRYMRQCLGRVAEEISRDLAGARSTPDPDDPPAETDR